MDEPARRTEEQIIGLFKDKETLLCQGRIRKKTKACHWVYPLYYKFQQEYIPDRIRRYEENGTKAGWIICSAFWSISVPLLSTGGEILRKTGGLKMDLQNSKCVMVIDESLPLGIIANTAAIMGITLGKQMPEVVGTEVYDRTGNGHLGIIKFPVPILKGNADVIKAIREKLYEPEFSELTVIDFSDLAQGCRTYDEFMEKMKYVTETELNYFGIAICGAKKKVNKLTGSMALLR